MKPIYLDYQATTPSDPRVVKAMQPYWEQDFGNPHSEGHTYGRQARRAVELARSQVADFIGADDNEIVFLSGATESCNLALRGAVNAAQPKSRREIITLATEHSAVLETAQRLNRNGRKATILPVQPDGLLDLNSLAAALSHETLLVSCMLANNEIGVIQPLKEIARLCREAGAFIHTDATQAAGRIPIDVDELGIDLLSLSAHKIYGPNGIGALYIRNRPDLRIEPMITGGSQEGGFRAGTVAAPLTVGLGAVCAIAQQELEKDAQRIAKLTTQLLQELKVAFPSLRIFGSQESRVPGNLSIGIPGVLGEQLVEAVSDKIAISTGAACATGSPEPSHVLTALGLDPEIAASAVRISIGRFTTEAEIAAAAATLRRAIETLTIGD